MAEQGTFHGVGVGPGDPKLLTLKACEVIRAADVVAYPVNEAGESFARGIASEVIPEGAEEMPIHVPMKVEREPAREAYDKAAAGISDFLQKGRNVAYLCVGDPLFYGSFMYLAARLGRMHRIEIVPGVTSLSACSARTRLPLAARNEVLSVVPATLDEAALENALARSDTLAIVKVGRHFAKVRGVLRRLGLARRATILSEATGAQESLLPLEDATEDDAPYFSTVLVRREDLT